MKNQSNNHMTLFENLTFATTGSHGHILSGCTKYHSITIIFAINLKVTILECVSMFREVEAKTTLPL